MLKKTAIAVAVVAAIVGAWYLWITLEGNRTVTVDLRIAESIDRIEFYDSRDDANPVARIYRPEDGRRIELPLRVYQEIRYQRSLSSVYYYFIMYKGEGGYKSDTFALNKFRSGKVGMTIADSGSWQMREQ